MMLRKHKAKLFILFPTKEQLCSEGENQNKKYSAPTGLYSFLTFSIYKYFTPNGILECSEIFYLLWVGMFGIPASLHLRTENGEKRTSRFIKYKYKKVNRGKLFDPGSLY